MKGDAEAQFELGKNYETGRIGLPKDLAEAQRWYHAAADQGDPYAEASLAILYNFGKGVAKDPVQAYMWYEIALAHSKTQDRDSILELRDDLAKDMTRPQIAEAEKRAREWKPNPHTESPSQSR
jgi:TPR repeat protein